MSDLQKTLQYKSTSTYKIKGEQNEKAKPLAERQTGVDKDPRRTFSRAVKDETWDNAEKVRGFDPYYVRKDFAGNIVVRFLTRDDPIRKYAAPEYEHIVSYVNNGKTVLENCAVIQAVFNASKGHEELFNIHPKECNAIIKKSGGIKGSEFRREIVENNLEHKKLNIRFEKTEKGLAPKVIAKTNTERPVYEPVYADKEDYTYKKYVGPDAKGKIVEGRENLEEFYNSVKVDSSKEHVLESDEETVRDSVRGTSEEPVQAPVPETTQNSPEPFTKESSKESTEPRKDRSKESTERPKESTEPRKERPKEYSYEPSEETSGETEGSSTLEKIGSVVTSLPAIKIVAGVIIVGGIVYGSYKLYKYYQDKKQKEIEKEKLEEENFQKEELRQVMLKIEEFREYIRRKLGQDHVKENEFLEFVMVKSPMFLYTEEPKVYFMRLSSIEKANLVNEFFVSKAELEEKLRREQLRKERRKIEELRKEKFRREELRRKTLQKEKERREEKEFLNFLDEIQYGGIKKHSDFYVRILSPTEKDDLLKQFCEHKYSQQEKKIKEENDFLNFISKIHHGDPIAYLKNLWPSQKDILMKQFNQYKDDQQKEKH